MAGLRHGRASAEHRRRLDAQYSEARADAMASVAGEADENEPDENEPDEDENGPAPASPALTQTARPATAPPVVVAVTHPPQTSAPVATTNAPVVTTSAPVVTTSAVTATVAPATMAPASTTNSHLDSSTGSTVSPVATTEEPTQAVTPSPGFTPSPRYQDSSSSAAENTGVLQSTASQDGAGVPKDGNTLMTVIIVLGSVTAVLVVVLAVFWFVWRKRRRQTDDKGSTKSPNWLHVAMARTRRNSSPSLLEERKRSTRSRSFPLRRGTATSDTSSNASASSSARMQSQLVDDVASVRIPFEKVTILNLVNSGGYGEVYRGMYHGKIVAVKRLLPARRREPQQINAFLAEVKLMAAMEHDRIVRFIGVAWDSLSDLCAVSEYMEGGDLRTLLTQFEARERRPKGFDRDKSRIALHVMHALTYLHSLDPVVLHRDLKSKNILLTADLDAKITDFGVSRESSDKTMTAGVGTPLWMAPEVMMGERYDEKADMFSFGVVLSELDSHLLPYAMAKETDSGRVLPDTALLQMVSLGRLRIEMSANAPQAVVDLAYACVDVDPEKRPSAPEALYCLDRVWKSYLTQ